MNEEALKKLSNTYSELEMKLLDELVQHFKINEEFINSDYWRIQKLEELGILSENIVKYVSQAIKKTPTEGILKLEILGKKTTERCKHQQNTRGRREKLRYRKVWSINQRKF